MSLRLSILLMLLSTASLRAVTNLWDAEIARFDRIDAVTPRPPHPVVFVGSSSFRLWPRLADTFPAHSVINRGFGGSHLSDINHHFHRAVGRLQPHLVLVYGGDNDLADGKSPAQVAADFARFRALLHTAAPDARAAFIAIKPSPSRIVLLPFQRQANALVQDQIRNDPAWTFLDGATPLLGPDGTPDPTCFVEDRLHLSPEGYRRWTAVVQPWLDRHAP